MRREVIVGANLSLGYQSGKSRKEVLQGINFKLFSGELTCLLGPNGVGKSTLIKAIMGRLPVWEGTLTVQGKSINQFTQKELAKNLAVVLTEPFIPGNMTVTQLVSLGRTPYLNWSGYLSDLDKKAVYKAIEDTKIAYIQHERLSDLSDGQRQKAFIARALAQDAPIMVLDEPTAHLDLVNRYEIMQLLREISLQKGKCVLVITHDLDIALESSDQIWLMNCGEDLVKGLPEDMVISGNINHLFPQEKFEFNTQRGRVEIKNQPGDLDIEGPLELIFWLKKALTKAGIYQVNGPIRIKNEPLFIFHKGKEYGSIESFIGGLRIGNK